MTITGIEPAGQSSDGNALVLRGVTTDTNDLDTELRHLETAVGAAPISVLPAPSLAEVEEPEQPVRHRLWVSPGWRDVFALLSFLAVAFFVTAPLWLHPGQQLRDDPQDQAFFEWMLAHGARVLTHGAFPFFSDRMNYPDGVNMMANTSVLAVSLPMTPVTLAFGPHVAFTAFLTGALVLTGASWYLVLSRKFVSGRLAAWVGALFCAFAPSMVSHAGGHPNIVSQFLLPLIIWRTLELRRAGRTLRNGLLLAGLLVWQAFINLEVLFMAAVGLGLFCVVQGIARRRTHPGEAAAFLRGLTVAGVASLGVLAYPLSVQFFGPQSYHGLPEFVRSFGADLASFTAYSQRSVAGSASAASVLAQNPSEENAFFGWGLVILFVGLAVWLRRSLVALTLTAIALVYAAFSLGPNIYLNGINTGVRGPWSLLHSIPVLNSAVPTRWAMAIAPIVGVMLALGCQRAADLVKAQPAARGPVRVSMISAVAMALVPLAPTPLATAAMDPVPRFVTSGQWRHYVDDRHTLVTLPLPDNIYPDALRWSAETHLDLRIAGAYALLPNQNPLDPADRTALFAPPLRPTSGLMDSIREGNPPPEITNTRRAMTLADLRYWKAAVVVLRPQSRDLELKKAMTDLLGVQPTWTGGLWVWDVRPLVDNPSATLTGSEIS